MKQKSLLMSLFLLFAGIVAGYAQQTTYKGLPTGDGWVRSDKQCLLQLAGCSCGSAH